MCAHARDLDAEPSVKSITPRVKPRGGLPKPSPNVYPRGRSNSAAGARRALPRLAPPAPPPTIPSRGRAHEAGCGLPARAWRRLEARGSAGGPGQPAPVTRGLETRVSGRYRARDRGLAPRLARSEVKRTSALKRPCGRTRPRVCVARGDYGCSTRSTHPEPTAAARLLKVKKQVAGRLF